MVRAATTLLLVALVAVTGLADATPAAAAPGRAPADVASLTDHTVGEELPACRYDDILTPRRAYEQWRETMLDTILRLPKSYVPPDLVAVKRAGIAGRGRVRRVVIADLRELAAAARAAGAPIAVQSAYRSFKRQRTLFNRYVARMGFKKAALVSARPGHSEHQLGTTLDFRSAPGGAPWRLADWGKTRAGSWMRKNAWKFGFVMSYPRAHSPGTTCYRYEPWHFHYVGRDAARAIAESELAPREWQWRQGYGLR